LLEIVPAEAEKVAVVAEAGTVTDAGTVRTALLSEIFTTVPPVGAGPEMVALQVLLALDARVAGVHVSEETVIAAGGVRVMVAVAVLPLSVAVTIAD